MIITNEKITVTEQMMFNEGLSFLLSVGQIGIPFSVEQKLPIEWKDLIDITESDFDKIEDYFLALKK